MIIHEQYSSVFGGLCDTSSTNINTVVVWSTVQRVLYCITVCTTTTRLASETESFERRPARLTFEKLFPSVIVSNVDAL